MHRFRRILFLTLVLAGLFNSVVKAVSPRSITLQGIRKISVVVEKLDEESTKYGVTEQTLRTQTELELRRTGITVGDRAESALDSPTLYVRLTAMAAAGLHVYHIELFVEQNATLRRDPNITAYGAITWDKTNLGIVGSTEYSNNVHKNLGTLLEMFLNDYLSVNPK
jgi:hypothetical protein